MKRSGTVGLVVMGGAAFAATFAGGMTYFAMQKPSHASPQAAAPAQTCTTQPDGTRKCQPQQRGFSYYLVPHFFYGGSSTSTPDPKRAPSAALTSSRHPTTPATSPSGVQRGGFGSTASNSSFRVSSGG